MFRELTDAEKADLYDMGRCPFCGNTEFFEGPHGGLAVNWCCANDRCLACFNLTPPALRSGQVIRESYLNFDSGKAMEEHRMPEIELRKLFKRRATLRHWFDMLKSSRWGD